MGTIARNWQLFDFLIKNILCCPSCQSAPLDFTSTTLSCPECNWQSTLIEGDTLSFAPVVYDGARTQTHRITQHNSSLNKRLRQLKSVHQRLVPWRKWIFRDLAYWRHAIEPLRKQETRIIKYLLKEVITHRRQILLELGVGPQSNVALYKQIAEYAICSDIYRDPAAIMSFKDVPWVFYCLINIEKLPLRESSIDILLTSHVVEHFPNHLENLKATHRILKPGGIACHVVPIAIGFILGHILATIINALTLVPRIGRGIHGEYDSIWQELHNTTLSAWRKLFENCGFEILREAPGTLGITPIRPSFTLWLSSHFHVYGSWVFVLRALK